MRKLVVLAVIAVALVAGDFFLKGVAESRIAAELESSFDPSGETTVELSGFPFVLHLLQGTIPAVEVTSTSLQRGRLRFSDVQMTLQDVRFSLSEVMNGHVGSIAIRDGRGRGSLRAAAVTKLFDALDAAVSVELDSGLVRAQVGPVETEAHLGIEDGQLVLSFDSINRTFHVDLPSLGGGIEYRSVRIDGTNVVVQFSLQNARLIDIRRR